MTIFDVLTLVGGLCLFLFGMNIMGQALERRAGSSLQTLLSKLTTNKIAGFFTGFCVTAVIQSSSATTVMVVGFVNSGLMSLKQAINVIIGANVGTTVTGWILAMETSFGDSVALKLLKPSSFTPILALIGIILYMFSKNSKKKDTGTILLGFAVLMFGMEAMSGSVGGLKESEAFGKLFVMFENPVLGVLVGAVLTAIIQSSSASVGILQALSDSKIVTFGAAIPIIMGQAIGTCITAVISCFGANRNAKSAAMAHLVFNVMGTVVWLTAFGVVDMLVLSDAVTGVFVDRLDIAVINTVFKILCTLLFLPISSVIEKIALKLIPEKKNSNTVTELDDRLLQTPAVALERCHTLAYEMADDAVESLKNGILCLSKFDPALVDSIKEAEDKTDHYEDIISTYLVKLSTLQIGDRESAEAAKLLKIIGDLERIGDHAKNLVDSAEEMKAKGINFSGEALAELNNLTSATVEILDLSRMAFVNNDMVAAATVEPLEQIIDKLKESMRSSHITRLQQGACSIETGFVWSDILTNLERVSDHCSNIAGCVIDAEEKNLNLHESIRHMKEDSPVYKSQYEAYAAKYLA
ncbi:MAG: Na/Pi cotransporter family protein [Ruminococcaceae bacterium]|nr:Na/Pi cotransporter family protein [Oscillospiraceae bacterium]